MTATTPPSPGGARLEPLRAPKIRPTTKRIFYLSPDLAKPFPVFGKPTEEDKRAVVAILARIRQGLPLDDYYRSGVENGGDELLDKYGVLHLHLANKGSKHLLYLAQYEHPDGDYVVILEVNDHKHVKNPVGALLTRYWSMMRKHRQGELAKVVASGEHPSAKAGSKVHIIQTASGPVQVVIRGVRRPGFKPPK